MSSVHADPLVKMLAGHLVQVGPQFIEPLLAFQRRRQDPGGMVFLIRRCIPECDDCIALVFVYCAACLQDDGTHFREVEVQHLGQLGRVFRKAFGDARKALYVREENADFPFLTAEPEAVRVIYQLVNDCRAQVLGECRFDESLLPSFEHIGQCELKQEGECETCQRGNEQDVPACDEDGEGAACYEHESQNDAADGGKCIA